MIVLVDAALSADSDNHCAEVLQRAQSRIYACTHAVRAVAVFTSGWSSFVK